MKEHFSTFLLSRSACLVVDASQAPAVMERSPRKTAGAARPSDNVKVRPDYGNYLYDGITMVHWRMRCVALEQVVVRVRPLLEPEVASGDTLQWITTPHTIRQREYVLDRDRNRRLSQYAFGVLPMYLFVCVARPSLPNPSCNRSRG